MNPIHKNKNFLVTGGTRGIGAWIVKVLAQEGASIAFTYRSNEKEAREHDKNFERLRL